MNAAQHNHETENGGEGKYELMTTLTVQENRNTENDKMLIRIKISESG